MCFLDRTQLIIAISQLCHKHNCKHIINKYIKVPMEDYDTYFEESGLDKDDIKYIISITLHI